MKNLKIASFIIIILLLQACTSKVSVDVPPAKTAVAVPVPPVPGAELSLVVTAAPVGNQAYSNVVSFTVEVTNTGSADIAGVLTSNLAAGWTEAANTCGADLEVSEVCTLTITTPSEGAGTHSNTIRFGNVATYEDLLLSYIGVGAAPPVAVLDLSLSITAAPVGNQAYGNVVSYTVEVTNTGNTTLAGVLTSNLAAGWTQAANTCGADLEVSEVCTLTITTPSEGAGTHSNTIRFGNVTTYKDLQLSYTGVGAAPVLDLSLSITASPVGNQAYSTVASFTVEVTNTGNTAILGVLTSNLASEWTEAANTCGVDLAVSEVCTLTITNPSPGAGTHSNTIRFGNVTTYKDVLLSYTGVAAVAPPSVEAIYPVNGAKWNDYVRRSVGVNSGNWYTQNDVACDGTEVGLPSMCIHAGEKKKVVLTGGTTCTGLAATDALGVFNWTCQVIGGVSTMVTSGIKENKRLSDLINNDINTPAWRSNSVTVTKTINSTTSAVATTASTVWWSNPVIRLVPNPASNIAINPDLGGVDSNVYVITASAFTRRINVDRSKIALVVKEGATLAYSVGASSNHIIHLQSSLFSWIEGDFVGGLDGQDTFTVDANSKFNKIRKVNARASQSSGLQVAGNSNFIKDVRVVGRGDGEEGLWIDGTDYSVFQNLNVSNSGSYHNIIFHNQGSLSENSTYVNIISTSGKEDGILIDSTSPYQTARSTFHNVTLANNLVNGFTGEGGLTAIFISNLLTTRNGEHGVRLVNANSNVTLANLASTNQGQSPLYTTNSTNMKMMGNVLVGNNVEPNCLTNGTNVNPPYVAACTQANGNVFNLASTTASSASSFVGQPAADDAINAQLSNIVSFASITDYFNFENFFRSWGKLGGLAGHCPTGNNCEIFDYQLSSGDSVFLDRLGDGTTTNDAFTAGLACPAEVDGSAVWTDTQTAPNTFLKMAFEVTEDSIGDDDGLCETNEACVYSPNFGAYQGSGDYLSNGACLFQDGTITGVTMYAYPDNGG